MTKTWNDNWLSIMRRCAQYTLNNSHSVGLIQVDELVNEAWLNSVKRLPKDSSDKMVGTIAIRSMRQYIVGKPRSATRTHNVKYVYLDAFDETDQTIHLQARKPRYTYDDVDDINNFLNTCTQRARRIVLLRIAGCSYEAIGAMLGKTFCCVWKTVEEERKQYVNRKTR